MNQVMRSVSESRTGFSRVFLTERLNCCGHALETKHFFLTKAFSDEILHFHELLAVEEEGCWVQVHKKVFLGSQCLSYCV